MLDIVRHDNGLITLRSPLLAAAGVPHAFTTRVGEHGGMPAWPALLDALGRGNHTLARVRQVHGCEVHLAVNADDQPDADAQVTQLPGVMLAILTADCVPILLATRDGKHVAAVHAGWRGLVAGVIPRAVEAIQSDNLVAAVGPAISVAHYEVGPEVLAHFPDDVIDGAHVNLPLAARLQLESAGVTAIDTTAECTFTNADWFHSYRRDKTKGRQAAVIACA